MLKILNEKKMRIEENVEKEYKNCMFILTDFSDLQNPMGRLYCVSASRDSYHEICLEAFCLEEIGVPCILMGNYKGQMEGRTLYEMAEV